MAGSPHRKTGRVYACEAVSLGKVKIGFTTTKIERRLTVLQTGCPVELRMIWSAPGTLELEYRLHVHFRDRHTWGEWFDFAGVDAVEELEKAAPGGVMPPREVLSPQPMPRKTQSEIDEENRLFHLAAAVGGGSAAAIAAEYRSRS